MGPTSRIRRRVSSGNRRRFADNHVQPASDSIEFMSNTPVTVTLFLCGDVMIGRGVDQILRHPSRPRLYEPVVKSASEYVALAERAHGGIPRRVDDLYVWGVALAELEGRRPAARIINLETSITTSEDAAQKGINYRMQPANVGVLSAARVDCAVLANNHVLDWGVRGLWQTLDTLAEARIRVAGAGRTTTEAEAPAVIDLGNGARILVFALGAFDAGVPTNWSATATRPGVSRIADYTASTARRLADLVTRARQPGDLVVVSLHWGPNWGYEIPDEHHQFAHLLIDAGVDIVFGHSSHHVKAIEVYRGRLILYGCGDFLNDYEGIQSPPEFRDDLTMMYFPTLDAKTGELVELEVVPLVIRRFQLQRPSSSDSTWLAGTMDRECRRFGARVVMRHGRRVLEWH
jgi:poly-gamma-glutamate synthesis protein (capsule biosynthesis protein)